MVSRVTRRFGPAVLAAALVGLPMVSGSTAPDSSPREIKRRVLALYKSSEGDSASFNRVTMLLEHPLDTLGLAVDYHDIDAGFPSDEKMAPYRGVITYFQGPEMRDARGYARWLARQAGLGRRVVIFGDYGAFAERGTGRFLSHDQVNVAFQALGLRYDGFSEESREFLSLEKVDRTMMEFEEPIHKEEVASYVAVRPLHPDSRSYLTLSRIDLPDKVERASALAVTTPFGGFAYDPYVIYSYRQNGLMKQRWHLNPYRFLREALGADGEPRFDAATLNGRRLWMAQVDGDGLLTPADAGALCGEVVRDQILKTVHFPVSASVTTGELEAEPRARDLAWSIFELENVEPAAHSHTHPEDWRAPGVNAAGDVQRSLDTLKEGRLPPGKKLRLFTWSGQSDPPAEAFAPLEKAGVENINGWQRPGGYQNRFDADFPSRTHLSPLVRRVGGHLQFNHRAANDYGLSDGGKIPGAYKNILATFESTARDPEIPVHLYFHWYAGETRENLAALAEVFRWSERQEVSPVFVSDYVRLARDFLNARLIETAKDRYEVRNGGFCSTVVFPTDRRHVDMRASQGVLGYAHRRGELYVFLDEGHGHVIELTDTPAIRPRLESASGWIERWAVEGDKISFDYRGFGRSSVVLAGMEGGYTATITPAGGKKPVSYQKITARIQDGRLPLEFNADGVQRVEIEPVSSSQALVQKAGVPVAAGAISAYALWFLAAAARRRRGV